MKEAQANQLDVRYHGIEVRTGTRSTKKDGAMRMAPAKDFSIGDWLNARLLREEGDGTLVYEVVLGTAIHQLCIDHRGKASLLPNGYVK
jgi:hypothetical protein